MDGYRIPGLVGLSRLGCRLSCSRWARRPCRCRIGALEEARGVNCAEVKIVKTATKSVKYSTLAAIV